MKEAKNFNYNSYNTFSSTGSANYTNSTSGNQFFNYHNAEFIDIYEGEKVIENGKYSVFEIADWFLFHAEMTHKKLQKLCYYAQAWSYTIKKVRLIDSDFQAWIHGPVSPALYERFKGYGTDGIRIIGSYNCIIQSVDIAFLENVWETYGDMTGNALEALSHREPPWINARKGYAPNERCSVVITPQSMIDYYSTIYIGNK